MLSDGLQLQPVRIHAMTAKQQSRIQQGRTRKRVVILALFAIAMAFYASSFVLMGG